MSIVQLWLPILLSAVFVFFASSLFNMLLKFWHMPDYKGFSNEDEVRAVLRKGIGQPGMYALPYCTPEAMKQPEMHEKFKQGPNAMIAVRPNGMVNLGVNLGQWFGFCLLVALVVACLGMGVLPRGADSHLVFHTIALAALLGFAFGPIPNAIWWGHPWGPSIKHVIDGVVYALITGATFAWLWPA